jgi:hypothetical protein
MRPIRKYAQIIGSQRPSADDDGGDVQLEEGA